MGAITLRPALFQGSLVVGNLANMKRFGLTHQAFTIIPQSKNFVHNFMPLSSGISPVRQAHTHGGMLGMMHAQLLLLLYGSNNNIVYINSLSAAEFVEINWAQLQNACGI